MRHEREREREEWERGGERKGERERVEQKNEFLKRCEMSRTISSLAKNVLGTESSKVFCFICENWKACRKSLILNGNNA